MLHQTFCSKKLLLISLLNLFMLTCSKTIREKHEHSSDSSKESSEIVEKILNVPVTLNLEDVPATETGKYGGYRRSFQVTPEEAKVDDGQFGARIILGIVENIPETTTKFADQSNSQTIVKFFDKENYDGIKNQPIIVDDNQEYDDEKTRNRKEIIDLKQVESPINADEDDDDKHEDEEQIQTTEHYEQNENADPEDHKQYKKEEIKEIPKYIYREGTKHRYEEYDIPPNHKETYTEIEEPKAESEELNDEKQDYVTQTNERLEEKETPHQEIKDTTNDQKGSADETHEEVKKKKKGGKHSSGKGEEHHSEHHEDKGEKGVKAYKGYHENTKSKKGHHDKEKHGNQYADKGGSEKKHHEEHGHHGEHHKGEKGEKESNFSEEGKHSKGHSTKGEHNIHKKDEYEKKQEFYDEHHEGGEHEKHGGFHFDDHFEKGGHEKGGHHKKGEHEDHYGKKSHHEKGHHYDDKKGFKKAVGHDEHHKHSSKHGKKGGDSGHKHWAYKKGTGGGGKKNYKAGPQVAHSAPKHKKIQPPPHNYKVKYPHHHAKIHIRNDNRRSDDVANITDDKVTLIEGKKDNVTNSQNKSEEESEENEESESVQTTKISNSINQTNPTNKTLPKIYVIIPDNFEEQLQESGEFSKEEEDISDFSLSDSEESEDFPNDNKVVSTHRKTTKIVEPLEVETFPEEHKRRLSEIEFVVHSIGTKYGSNKENVEEKPISRKPRKFSVVADE